MRSHPALFRVTFLLPAGSQAEPGRHQPSAEGCTLDIQSPFVEICGPSREACFEHAARLVRIACKGRHNIDVRVQQPGLGLRTGYAWQMTVGADVSFSPTSMDPYLPRATPVLELVVGGRS